MQEEGKNSVYLFVFLMNLGKGFMNKDDKNRKHGEKEMGHVKMADPGFVNDATA